jgi:hypothetical protein
MVTIRLSRPIRFAPIVVMLVGLSLSGGCSGRDDARSQADKATANSSRLPVPAETGRSIQVSVKLNPALAKRTSPNDTVFIFARAAQGPKMPLATVRKQVKDLPATVTLDDSMAMVPNMNMSSFPELVIGARVSLSGDPVARPGDMEGYAPPVKANATGPVEVVIASVVSNAAAPLPAARPADAGDTTGFNHAKSALKSRLDIPDAVKAKWKGVELSIAGKDIPARTAKIAVGSRYGIDRSSLALQVVAYVPSFSSNLGTVTSTSNNPDNPAVLVRLLNKERVVKEGWVFQKLPDFNTYNGDIIQIKLLGAFMDAKG